MSPLFLVIASLSSILAYPSSLQPRYGGINDFDCQLRYQHYPVLLLHGLGGNKDNGLNVSQAFLASKGFCTYSITYGDYPAQSTLGGFRPIPESSKEIADYITNIANRTGAKKIDLVGHSEGGFMTLYVPKFYPTARQIIRKSIAVAPPTHGTTLNSVVPFLTQLGVESALETSIVQAGCPALVDLLVNSTVVKDLAKGGVTQSGIKYTVIASTFDETVTPAPTASFIKEAGVRNLLIQDYCPLDTVGHSLQGLDANVFHLILNELQDRPNHKFKCSAAPSLPPTS